MRITVDLKGGLGNQLFQIFTTTAYSIRHKFKLNLPNFSYKDNILKHLKFSRTCFHYTDYKETDFKFSSLPIFKKATRLCGYFQSYKYFEKEYSDITKNIKLLEQQEELRSKHSLFNCTSMHFRLGDYKKCQEYHPLMPYEYYKSSLIELKSEKILYFCEAEDNVVVTKMVGSLSSEFGIEFIKVSDSIPDWEQLLMMSCCDHNIIANSTFSWWGAYFNSNPNKRVYYPDKWFGPMLNYSTVDLFPTTWNSIKL